MNTIKKLAGAAFVAVVGLCSSLWAEPAAGTDFEFDPETGTITKYVGACGDVEIPAKLSDVDVTAIGADAFAEIPLKSVTIPASVTNIGRSAFYYCQELGRITFADGSQLETIEAMAFSECLSLDEITIPSGVKAIGAEAFDTCILLAEITIPSSVREIGAEAFAGCHALASVTFAEGSQLETIGTFAFESCFSLGEITIPSSVTNVGNAFCYCSKLTDVTILATTPPTVSPTAEESMFEGCPSRLVINVPQGTAQAYIAADGWRAYKDSIAEAGVAKITSLAFDATISAKDTSGVGIVATVTPAGETLGAGEIWAWAVCDAKSENKETANAFWNALNDAIGRKTVGMVNLLQITNGLDSAFFGTATTSPYAFANDQISSEGWSGDYKNYIFARVRESDGAILSIGGVRNLNVEWTPEVASYPNAMLGRLPIMIDYCAWDGTRLVQCSTNAIPLADDADEFVDGGWYVAAGNGEAPLPIACYGSSHLILLAGANYWMNFSSGVEDASLSVHADREYGDDGFMMPSLSSDFSDATHLSVDVHGAYVTGGTDNARLKALNLYGGEFSSISDQYDDPPFAALHVEESVNVFGGYLVANSVFASGCAGIGGNAGEPGCTVNVYGGEVAAYGGEGAPGIGAGAGCPDHGKLTIAAGLHTWAAEESDGPKHETLYAASRERNVWVTDAADLVHPQDFTIMRTETGVYTVKLPDSEEPDSTWAVLGVTTNATAADIGWMFGEETYIPLGEFLWPELIESVEGGTMLTGEMFFSDLDSFSTFVEIGLMSADDYFIQYKKGLEFAFSDMPDLDMLFVAKVTDDDQHKVLMLGGVKDVSTLEVSESKKNEISDGTVSTSYYDWDGTALTGPLMKNAIPVTEEMTELNSGWYVVQDQVVIDRTGEELPGLKVSGNVHLILADGAELVVTGANNCAGIEVGVVDTVTNSLTIYGQAGQSGKLTATGIDGGAGIGGNHDQACGMVTINGGEVMTAALGINENSFAAGIGGGYEGSGGTVTINAGTVTANGGDSGAGIGSGGSEGKEYFLVPGGSVVVINGGTVTAMGEGVGIGGGQRCESGSVTINGGTVTAVGSLQDAGIGNGSNSDPWTVTINGGTVTAMSFAALDDMVGGIGAGIGGSAACSGCNVKINGGEVTAISHPVDAGDGVILSGEGIGAGAMAYIAGGNSGTLDMSGYGGTYYIYAGMDETGVEAEEVQADDFETWHTNCYVQITQTKRQGPAEGSPENPWKVGVEGAEETVLAYTNGTGKVVVTGEGTPKTFGAGDEPWVGAVPPIKEILVPQGMVGACQTAWPAGASKITDGKVAVEEFTVVRNVDGSYQIKSLLPAPDSANGVNWLLVTYNGKMPEFLSMFGEKWLGVDLTNSAAKFSASELKDLERKGATVTYPAVLDGSGCVTLPADTEMAVLARVTNVKKDYPIRTLGGVTGLGSLLPGEMLGNQIGHPVILSSGCTVSGGQMSVALKVADAPSCVDVYGYSVVLRLAAQIGDSTVVKSLSYDFDEVFAPAASNVRTGQIDVNCAELFGTDKLDYRVDVTARIESRAPASVDVAAIFNDTPEAVNAAIQNWLNDPNAETFDGWADTFQTKLQEVAAHPETADRVANELVFAMSAIIKCALAHENLEFSKCNLRSDVLFDDFAHLIEASDASASERLMTVIAILPGVKEELDKSLEYDVGSMDLDYYASIRSMLRNGFLQSPLRNRLASFYTSLGYTEAERKVALGLFDNWLKNPDNDVWNFEKLYKGDLYGLTDEEVELKVAAATAEDAYSAINSAFCTLWLTLDSAASCGNREAFLQILKSGFVLNVLADIIEVVQGGIPGDILWTSCALCPGLAVEIEKCIDDEGATDLVAKQYRKLRMLERLGGAGADRPSLMSPRLALAANGAALNYGTARKVREILSGWLADSSIDQNGPNAWIEATCVDINYDMSVEGDAAQAHATMAILLGVSDAIRQSGDEVLIAGLEACTEFNAALAQLTQTWVAPNSPSTVLSPLGTSILNGSAFGPIFESHSEYTDNAKLFAAVREMMRVHEFAQVRQDMEPVAMIVTDDGATTNLYYSVQAAFDSAYTADQSVTNTVTILRDYTELGTKTAKIRSGKTVADVALTSAVLGNVASMMLSETGTRTVRLDLNGKTFVGGSAEGTVLPAVVVGEGSVLIIDDSDPEKKGVIARPKAVTQRANFDMEEGLFLGATVTAFGDVTLCGGKVKGEEAFGQGANSDLMGIIAWDASAHLTIAGGVVENAEPVGRSCNVDAGAIAYFATFSMTDGKVKDSILNVQGKVSVTGGLFGTDDVSQHPEWIAPNHICVENDDAVTRAEGYNWAVLLPTEGSKWKPWNVGPEGSDHPQAYTNGNGGLVIEGEGPVEKKPWLDDKDGITKITITDPGTELPDDAFTDMGSDEEKIKLVLPDNWQGKLPDEGGNWYGAKAEIETWPLMIRNVRFQQRYPWNGLVDIYADVYGPETNDVTLYVSAYNGDERLNVAIPEENRTVTLSNGLNPVHLVWDAENDVGVNGFRSENVTVGVSTRESGDDTQTAIAVAWDPIWEGEEVVGSWNGSLSTLSWGGYDWSSVEVGKVLEVHYTINPDFTDPPLMRLGNGSWIALPSSWALPGADGEGNVPLTDDPGVVRIVLTEEDKQELVNNGGLVVCGAWFVVNKVVLTDNVPPPVEPTGPDVSARSEAGRLDLRDPIIVAPGESDEITYSANGWSGQPTDESVNIHFGPIRSESPEELDALPVVFENLTDEGALPFIYPEKTGSYLFMHKYVPPANANKTAQSESKRVFVVWYIGADDPKSVYALDIGNGEIYVMGEGYMRDFGECGPWGTDITGVTIQHGVHNVGRNAFRDCTKMTHAELPASMEFIGDGAFSGDTGLQTIGSDAVCPPWFYGDPFTGVTQGEVTVFVPDESYGEYVNSEFWAPFWVQNKSAGAKLNLTVVSFECVSHTVKVNGEVWNEGSYHYSQDIPYGSKVEVTATITDEACVFDDGSSVKTFAWNFWNKSAGIHDEIKPFGADWLVLQRALSGTPTEDLRGAIEYENANGTNVVKLLRDISTRSQYDQSLAVTNAAVLDLAGRAVNYGNGSASVIGVGGKRVTEYGAYSLPGWLNIVDTVGGGRITKQGVKVKLTNSGILQMEMSQYTLGGGVTVLPESTCIMAGGAITGCNGNMAGGVYNEGTFVLAGGEIAGNACKSSPPKGNAAAANGALVNAVIGGLGSDGIMNMPGAELVITGGKVRESIYNLIIQVNVAPMENGEAPVKPVSAEPVVEISGGYFGTAVTLNPAWIVEGHVVVPDAAFAGYDKKVIEIPPEVLEAREKAKDEIEKKAGPDMTRSDEMDDLVEEAFKAIDSAYPLENVETVLADYLPRVADQYAQDNADEPQTATATGRLDLRSHVALREGEAVVNGITYSDSNWGETAAGAVTISQKNLETARTMTVAEGLTGASDGASVELTGQDTEPGFGHKLFHAVRGTVLESFVTFVFSGFERGCPTNPWEVGPEGNEPDVQVYVDDDPNADPQPGKELVIKGEGPIDPKGPGVPWNDRRAEITEIFVASGVVLNASALVGYPNLQRIVFEDPNYRLPREAMDYYWDDSVLVDMTYPSDGVYVCQFNGRQKVTAFFNEDGGHTGSLVDAYNAGFDPILFSTVPLALIDTFPAPSTIEPIKGEDDTLEGWEVILNDDLSTPIELSDDVGPVVIDLNGHNVVGLEGFYNGMDEKSRNGQPAFVIRPGETGGEPLELTIIDSQPDDTPDVIGGKGADGNPAGNGGPAIFVDPHAQPGVKVIVGPNVTLKGGDAGTGLGQDGEGGDVPPGAPGPAAQPEDVIEVLEGGTTEGGESAEGGVAAWAKVSLAGVSLPPIVMRNLPQGVTGVGDELWFWRRLDDKTGPATFDFGELLLDEFVHLGIMPLTVEFVDGPIDVDTIKAPANFSFRFVGGTETKLVAKTGKSVFEIAGDYALAEVADPVIVWKALEFTCADAELATDRWGGAIRMEGGAMEVENCTFADCFADDYGGAIFAFGLERDSSVTGCRFENCFVDGMYGYGGAIYASAKVAGHAEPGVHVRFAVNSSTFSGNAAVNGGAICTMRDANADDLINEQPIELVIGQTSFMANAAEYDGGAIFAEGPVTIVGTSRGGTEPGVIDPTPLKPFVVGVVRNTSFYRNLAGGSGGAIAMDCVVGEWFVPAKLSVGEGASFTENMASNAYTYALGGAIAHLQPGGEIEIFGARFLDNTAVATGINVGLAYALGGAVYADEDAVVSIEKTRLFGNWAVSESSFAYGGAGSFATGSAKVTACSFDGNGVAAPDEFYGGALDFAGTGALVKDSTFRGSNVEAVDAYGAALAFTNCVIVGNATLLGDEGADIYITDTPVDMAWTAYGSYDVDGETTGVFDDEAKHNLPGSTTAIYDPAVGAEPTLNPEGYVPAAALGLEQEATDINSVAYGSKFWGYSMGAYECRTRRDGTGIVVTIDPEEYAWTGRPIEPHRPVHVYDAIIGSNLVEGVDYTLSWADNVNPTDRAIVTATSRSADYDFTAGTNFWITAYYVDYYLDDATAPYQTQMFGELSHSNVTAQVAPPAGYVYDPITSMPTGTVRRFDGVCPYLRNGQLTLLVRYAKDEGGDDVPDIYQKKMHLKVVNGWWNDELNGADKIYWVTLYDEEGKWSTTGTGRLGENPTNRAETVTLAAAGLRPFNDFTASGNWWYLFDASDFTKIDAPAGLEVRSGSWPFVIFLYDRKNESAGGRTGRGGRGGTGGTTDAVAEYKLRAALRITNFAYADGKAAGEAWASVVDETTGQTLLDELLRRTKIDVLATPSLDKGEWSVIGSPTTDGEGGWGTDERPAAETPAQMFFKLRLR